MITLDAIIEDSAGNVIGARLVNDGNPETVTLPEPFPRSELASRAAALASAYGVTLPSAPAE